ncbi:hypothetical protein PanWU01x14_305730, partial [Parasponia andersonii]
SIFENLQMTRCGMATDIEGLASEVTFNLETIISNQTSRSKGAAAVLPITGLKLKMALTTLNGHNM